MGKPKNPLFEEALRVLFGDRRVVLLLEAQLLLLLLILILSWPGSDIAAYVLRREAPATYSVVVVFSFIAAVLLNALLGSESIGRFKYHSTRDWLELTPVSPAAYLAGKAASSGLHCLTITALAFPFILLAGAPAGASAGNLLLSTAAIFLFSYTYRMLASCLLLFLEERRFLLQAALWSLVLLLTVVSASILPAANPVYCLQAIDARDGGALPAGGTGGIGAAFLVHAGILLLLGAAALLRLRRLKRGAP